MAIDWEKKFYEEVAKIDKIKDDIEDIKEDIGELQSSYKKLKKRIDLQGIQDQLNSLHDSLSETRRWLAYVHIHEYCLFLDVWIANKLSEKTSPTFEQATEFIRTKGTKAHAKIEKSSNPMPIATQFMTDCAEYFQIHGIEPFCDYKIL